MNNITVCGNIAKTAELRTIPQGDQVAQFSVADNQIGKDKQAIFWNCSLFGKRAASLVDYLQKGTAVTVVGQVTQREYVNKDGQTVKAMEIRVQDVALQGGKKDQTEAPRQAAPQRQQAPKPQGSGFDGMDDDIPF